MLPIVTPEEMAAIDEVALEAEPIEAVLARVGSALARQAIGMLGGTYGRRVVAVAGPGLNGADARCCCDRLERRGVRTTVLSTDRLPDALPACDLIIDGAFGTGLSRPWSAPDPGDTPVLAVDIPSGVDGLTGEMLGSPMAASRTLTMAALKPGLLFGAGPDVAGDVVVADIGLDVSSVGAHLIEDADLVEMLPVRRRDSHKWSSALLVVAGSPGMAGASHLVAAGAMKAGAGYVHLDTAATDGAGIPTEVVSSLGGTGVRPDHSRFSAAVVGPGLGRSASPAGLVRTVLGAVDLPAVVDGDGLAAIAESPEVVQGREAATVLTPHDGEFERLTGTRPEADRIASARSLAARLDAVVLLKGPATVVANPSGRVLVSTTGDARLATAGSGDVLSGIIGAFLAQGVPAFEAAAAGAFVHGRAAERGPATGLVASDLPPLIPEAVTDLHRRCQAP